MSSSLKPLFQLKCLIKSNEIRLSAVGPGNDRQLIALVLRNGGVLLYHKSVQHLTHQVRWIPWYSDAKKAIQCITFDPMSGAWLLLACYDGTLRLLPTFSLFGQKNPVDNVLYDWSFDDVTALSVNYNTVFGKHAYEFHPTAVTWWLRHTTETDKQNRDIAVVGGKCGTVVFVSLHTGNVIASTDFNSQISNLNIIRNGDSSEGNTVLLLVTGIGHQQWKIVLEHHDSGSYWPFPYDEKSKIDLSGSSCSLTADDIQQATKHIPSFPSARLRLQGLKQLSVEKLASLRQRLSDGRSRSFNMPSPSFKMRGVADESRSYRSSVDISSMDSATSVESFNSICYLPGGASGVVPRILSVCNTHLRMQRIHSRIYLSGYYAPADLLTVYTASFDMNPVSIHRLCMPSNLVLVTDRLMYCVNDAGSRLSIISCRLSECQVVQEKQILNNEPNTDSLVCEFVMPVDELIVALHRIPSIKQDVVSSKMSCDVPHKSPHKSKRSYNKTSSRNHIELYCSELCAVVTTNSVYIINVKPVHEEVLSCVTDIRRLEDGEKLCRIFSLDLQRLLEVAADQQLEAGLLDSGMELYSLSKCKPLKSVLRLAAAGHTLNLLPYAEALLKSNELSPSEQLHLSNLSLLSYTEKALRAKRPERVELIRRFTDFLSENMLYDEELAVNVVAQSGLCHVLLHLARYHGLYSQVADVMARLLTHHRVRSHGINLLLTDSFWECLSDESICESYITNTDVGRTHLEFIKCKLPSLSQDLLERFAKAFDPSRPSLRPILRMVIRKIKLTGNGGQRSSDKSSKQKYSSQDADVDADDTFPFKEWLNIYFLASLYLVHSRSKFSSQTIVSPVVATPPIAVAMGNRCIQLSSTDTLFKNETTKDSCKLDSGSVRCSILSAGFTHCGLVRNRQLITWGQTSYGRLGTGPDLNRTCNPMPVALFSSLPVSVLGVSCGRMHTLALTDNGVYSWGSSKFGQLGIGKIGKSPQPRSVTTLSDKNIIAIEAGQYHSMAITADGKLWTWGWGVHGQLGHGNVEDQHFPAMVHQLSNEVCLSCSGGHAHSLVLTATGQVWAFGSSVFGQLGTGSNIKSSRPVQVFGLPEHIIMITTAYFHNLALAASNRLYTWGSSPQVLRLQAQAQKRARFRMQQMQSQCDSTDCNSGSASYNTGVEFNSALSSMANNNEDDGDESQGKGVKSHFKMVPASRFTTLNTETAVVSPSTEMKALPTGRNLNDVSDNPTFTVENVATSTSNSVSLVCIDDCLAHLSPTLVDTSHVVGQITAISCGCHHSALLTDAGKVHTWGRNLDGQLGNGARTKEALHPTQIDVGDPVTVDLKHLVCGGEFTLGMERNGKLWAWGSNQHGQLGQMPIEDSTKSSTVLLKTSKRVIKLPHGSLNTADVAKEINGLPPVEVYGSQENEGYCFNASELYPMNLSDIEVPPHGLNTLHYALHYFDGLFDKDALLDKCVELEDWQTAAKLYVLKEQYDQALKYQLKAAAVKNSAIVLDSNTESPSSISTADKKFLTARNLNEDNDTTLSRSMTEQYQSTICSSDIVTAMPADSLSIMNEKRKIDGIERQDSSTTVEEEDVYDDDDVTGCVKMQPNGSGSSSYDQQSSTMTVSDTASLSDERMTVIDESTLSEETTSASTTATREDNAASETHVFAVQGGTEEMSQRSDDDKYGRNSKAAAYDSPNESSMDDENTIGSSSEMMNTLNLSVNQSNQDSATAKSSNSQNWNGNSSVSSTRRGDKSGLLNFDFDKVNGSRNSISMDSSEVHSATADSKKISNNFLSNKEPSIDYTTVENEYNATINSYIKIVEYYISYCKSEPVLILRNLLFQALDFWLDHALPVSTIESFLKEHWEIVHYPLGILLFGQEPSDGSIRSGKILCRLSTEFNILLCSSMVDHVSDKNQSCPEMIDVLSSLCWKMHPVSGTSLEKKDSNESMECPLVSVEQDMNSSDSDDYDARLLDVLDELCSPQGVQSYIDINFPEESKRDELSSSQSNEVIVFTCGHRFEGNSALEKAVTGAVHSLNQSALPNTADALRNLFGQSQSVRQYACPVCILHCVESELI